MLLIAISAVNTPAQAQPSGPPPVISEIKIVGNQRVEDDAIRVHITVQPGQPLNQNAVNQDIKSIYRMGFFDRVSAALEHQGGKTILVYRVRERPMITNVKLEGMKAIRTDNDKVVAAVALHPGEILNPVPVRDTIKALEGIYQDKGYLDAKVTFEAEPQPNNQAVGIFHVSEGPKVEITDIEFTGNHAFSARQLRRPMETCEHNVLSFITGCGVLDHKKLAGDVDSITAFYYDHGYLDVHVADPVITRHANSLTVTIAVQEGKPYKVGTVEVSGDLKYPRSEVMKVITLKPGTLFRGSHLQHNVLAVSDFYSNRGYAFVNVDPRTQLDSARHQINIDFKVTPGQEVLIDRINITGNTKTADKVIRRQMQIQEQEPYSAAAIRKSKEDLDRLGYFTQTRITTSPAPQPNKIDLNVNVAEANTASFQVAGGFDSYTGVFGNFTLQNSNLFGGGESAALNATVGFFFQNYSISYTEPWFLDMPLSVTTTLFDNTSDLFSFNQSAAGFSLQTGYPLARLGLKRLGPFSLEDVTAGVGYTFESVGITGLSPFTTFQISRFKGYTKISELTPQIRRFTVDNPIDPRSGSIESLNLEIAALGSPTEFLKGVAHWRWFYTFLRSPTFGQWVYSPGVTFGIGSNLKGGTGGDLPLQVRFFPGGVGGQGDVRGYQLYSLSPIVTVFDQSGFPVNVEEIGGSKELLIQNEITFPILSGLGIRGVLFSDAGQSYLLRQSIKLDNLQYSYGVGIRWRSPFGPLSIDVARPINPRPIDQGTVFEIGAGAPL